jgi:hypothetical protein
MRLETRHHQPARHTHGGRDVTAWTKRAGADLMDEERRCRGTSKQSGERCKRAAIPGGRVCVMHGGASPQARAAAQRRQAEAQATAALQVIWNPDAAPVTDPVAALAALAGKLEHAVDVLGARVEVSDMDGTTALAWSRSMRELRSALEALERLGLQERQVRVAELAGQQLAAVVRAVLDRMLVATVETVGAELAAEMGLQSVWAQSALTIVPDEFRRLADGESVVRGELG